MSYKKRASRKLFALWEKSHNFTNEISIASTEDKLSNLVLKGADPNFLYNGSSILCEVCTQGQYALVNLLLLHGALVDIRNKDGETPLCLAVSRRRLEIVELLLSFGADVNAQTDQGHSPLVYAFRNGSNAIVRVLVENGANVNIKPPFPAESLLQFVIAQSNVDVANLILDGGASPYCNSSFLTEDNIIFLLRRRSGWPCLIRKWVAVGFSISSWANAALKIRKKLTLLLAHSKATGQVYELSVSEALQEATDLATYIENTQTAVSSLQQVCRTHIRHELVFSKSRGHIRAKIDKLPLPENMKMYLRLDE